VLIGVYHLALTCVFIGWIAGFWTGYLYFHPDNKEGDEGL
jgi:hypothetical protein